MFPDWGCNFSKNQVIPLKLCNYLYIYIGLKGRFPVSQVHVHVHTYSVNCSGLFLPRDAAEQLWSFLPGTGFQNPPSHPNIWYPTFKGIRALIFGVKMGLSNQNQGKQNRPHFKVNYVIFV